MVDATFETKTGFLPRENPAPAVPLQTYAGKVQKGLKVAGVAKGSSEYATLGATELALTFDMTANAVGTAATGKKLVLNVRITDSSGNRVAWRASSVALGTADATAHWLVLTSEDYSWNPVDLSTLYVRTVSATNCVIYYEIAYV